jgi:hypothetical protein
VFKQSSPTACHDLDVSNDMRAHQRLCLHCTRWLPHTCTLDCQSPGLLCLLQLRSRSSLAVPAGSDQAKSPLLRYWGGLNSSSSSSSNAVLPLQPQLAGQQRGATTSSKPGSKVAGGVTGPAQGAPDASSKWVLNPTVSGSTRAKLTTSAVAGQLLPSCCEARVPKGEPQLIKVARDTPASELEEVVRAATTGAGSSSRKAAVNGVQADELLLQAARAEAVQLVKGLQAEQPSSEDEVESEASSAGRPGSQQKVTRARPVTAVDVLTPDGMPVLGWHPEFEEGRVLVALCASGAWSAPSVGNLDSSSSISSSTVTASTHISTSNTGGDGSSTSSTQPAVWGSAGTDGWALSPLLAKGAANLICGVAATDSSLDMRLLSVKVRFLELVSGQPVCWFVMRGNQSRCAAQHAPMLSWNS